MMWCDTTSSFNSTNIHSIMKIATITIFCNEEFRLNNWKELYNEYKDDVALHVIVNNGCSDDTKILQDNFPNSLVIESKTNNMMA